MYAIRSYYAEQARTTHKAAEKAHEAVDNIEQLAEQMEERFRQLADDIKEQTRHVITSYSIHYTKLYE